MDKCDSEGAFYWSKMAADSVKGNASRLAWYTKHLVLKMNSKKPYSIERQGNALDRFYSMLISLPDGFLGRNKLRIKKAGRAVTRNPERKKLLPIISGFQTRCKDMLDLNKRRHFKHFQKPK